MTQPVLQDYFAGFVLTDEERFIRSNENLSQIKAAVENLIRKKFPQLQNFVIPEEEVQKAMRVVIQAVRIEKPTTGRLKPMYPPRINTMIAQRLYSQYLVDLYAQDDSDLVTNYEFENKSNFAIPTRMHSRPALLYQPNTGSVFGNGM